MRIPKIKHWRDENPSQFTVADRDKVTLLTTGLPDNTMRLFASAMRFGGVKVQVLPHPDNDSLAVGKEFGNRGQCNPTYFTVGNLVKYLIYLRDEKGIPTEKIISNYAFVTAGGCGPCRMGMYATEYRKSLRDSGFKGFRVLIFSRSGDVKNALSDGLKMNTNSMFRAFLSMGIGDILNTRQLQIRPFEENAGETDKVIEECRVMIEKSIGNYFNLIKTCRKVKKKIDAIKTDNTQKRPKVYIVGEFWAKTTEGAGNYDLYRFLEKEGAIAVNETVTDWLLHQIWRAKWGVERRKDMAFQDNAGEGLKDENITQKLRTLAIADKAIRGVFYSFSHLMGLKNYKLSDHDYIASLAEPYFDLHVDGGEDHMEVGHHIYVTQSKKADMVLSVKPFTCLSSNGVSDGVQAKVTADYPESLFVSVETNGDAAANFYSRIQMQLHRAKARVKAAG